MSIAGPKTHHPVCGTTGGEGLWRSESRHLASCARPSVHPRLLRVHRHYASAPCRTLTQARTQSHTPSVLASNPPIENKPFLWPVSHTPPHGTHTSTLLQCTVHTSSIPCTSTGPRTGPATPRQGKGAAALAPRPRSLSSMGVWSADELEGRIISVMCSTVQTGSTDFRGREMSPL